MFSASKAIIAGALVFGVGGAFLVAQPLGQQGSVPGAETQEEPAAPVEFTGKIGFGPCPGAVTSERLPGKFEYRGEHYCELRIVEPFTDPRLQGDAYVWNFQDVYDGGPEIYSIAFSIVNGDGAWRGVPVVSIGSAKTDVLIGEGAYEGLTAIAEVNLGGDAWDWHGWIIEGGVPPEPEEPAAIP